MAPPITLSVEDYRALHGVWRAGRLSVGTVFASTTFHRAEKRRSLRFTIPSTNVPAPYSVYWKVRNGGEEASRLGQLRGDITKDAGSQTCTETTSYKGTHYVECFIVKNGVVVARDRQSVIVT